MNTKTNEAFCIKSNYRPNLRSQELEVYWNPERIELASHWQYYVYEKGRRLLQQHNLKSVLDVGCGPAPKIKDLIWPYCHDVVLVDHPLVASLAKESLPVAEFVGLDLEVASADLGRRFQLIMCADVIEHLLDPDPCVAFIRRHLAPDGFAVISTPERDINHGPNSDECRKAEHVREWNRTELALYLRKHGFEVREHLLYPLGRVSRVKFLVSRTLPRFILPPYYCGSQVVICRLSGV